MAVRTYTAGSETVGAITSAAVFTCNLVVPTVHKLQEVTIYASHVVFTGTVTLKVLQSDPGDSDGGALVGEAIDPDAYTITANTLTKFTVLLGDSDKGISPANRRYWISVYGTDAADRVDRALLVLAVNDSLT